MIKLGFLMRKSWPNVRKVAVVACLAAAGWLYFGYQLLLLDHPTAKSESNEDLKVLTESQQPLLQRKEPTNSMCSNEVLAQLELFLTLPASDAGLAELSHYLLPGLALFWPRSSLKMVVVSDNDSKNLGYFSAMFSELMEAKRLEENVRLEFHFSPIPFHLLFRRAPKPPGWHRQQWLMLWADNFTSAEYVGFVDSDTFIVTRVTSFDLFVGDRPIVRAVDTKGTKTQGEKAWWRKSSKATLRAIGKQEPFNCMTYFPVIVKTAHLRAVREHIRQQLGASTFDEAFVRLQVMNEYSQFCIICAYLWYYQRGSYYWVVTYNTQADATPVLGGQITESPTGISQEILQRQRSQIAAHWRHEPVSLVHNGAKLVLRAGVCYSMSTADLSKRPSFCFNNPEIADRTSSVNPYEWTFEGLNFANFNNSRALNTHLERIRFIDSYCPPHEWNQTLINELF